MIDYIRGEIVELTPVLLHECSGIGYLVNISLNTYTALNSQKSAKYIFMKRFANAYALRVCGTSRTRCFYLLISVSGVGPRCPCHVVFLEFQELEMAIATENVALLQSVKVSVPKRHSVLLST